MKGEIKNDLESALRYGEDVLNGKIITCDLVKKNIRRHIRDMAEQKERGIYFDEKEAAYGLEFFNFLQHSKGEWAGDRFILSPWESWIVIQIFGWRRADDGTRRFRTAYLEVARKNGKTTFAAGIALYFFDGDDEPGAEVYSAATKYDQARISHAEATRMVKRSPYLRDHVQIFKNNLSIEATESIFIPLGRDHDSLDGLNVSAAIVDEVHAMKSRDMWDVLETATGARRQPIMFAITTAGFRRISICRELHDYTVNILEDVDAEEKTFTDDSFFGIIYTLDDEEEWKDERNWIKANPNIDISVKREDLRRKSIKAGLMPSALNSFLRLHMNIWTQSETRWINPDIWKLCGGHIDLEALRGRICYAGLDLSSNIDISAFALVFPPEKDGDKFLILVRFWIPRDNMIERSRKDKVHYDVWEKQGFIQATEGNVIDYRFILDQIGQDAERYDIQELAFDRWGATKIMTELQEMGWAIEPGLGEKTLVQFGQGFASMSPPTKALERLILAKELNHGNNPVLAWMAGNTVVQEDPAGNMKPNKAKSVERIDGMVATIMALDRAMRLGGQEKSVYETEGIFVL